MSRVLWGVDCLAEHPRRTQPPFKASEPFTRWGADRLTEHLRRPEQAGSGLRLPEGEGHTGHARESGSDEPLVPVFRDEEEALLEECQSPPVVSLVARNIPQISEGLARIPGEAQRALLAQCLLQASRRQR